MELAVHLSYIFVTSHAFTNFANPPPSASCRRYLPRRFVFSASATPPALPRSDRQSRSDTTIVCRSERAPSGGAAAAREGRRRRRGGGVWRDGADQSRRERARGGGVAAAREERRHRREGGVLRGSGGAAA